MARRLKEVTRTIAQMLGGAADAFAEKTAIVLVWDHLPRGSGGADEIVLDVPGYLQTESLERAVECSASG